MKKEKGIEINADVISENKENDIKRYSLNKLKPGSKFLSGIEVMKAKGLNEKKIAEAVGMDIHEFRNKIRISKDERRKELSKKASKLMSEGKSLREIAKIMGYSSTSSVRSLMTVKPKKKVREVTDILRKELREKQFVEVGKGAEKKVGCTRRIFDEALFELLNEGFCMVTNKVIAEKPADDN